MEEEGMISENDTVIEIVPIWKWLLEGLTT